jgi:hypothetical protein
MRSNIQPPVDLMTGPAAGPIAERGDNNQLMERQPMPGFWIAMQIVIVICVLISAVIVIVKL